MLSYRYPLIAREGAMWVVLLAVIAGVLQYLFGWLATPLWLAAIVGLFLYRDPARRVPAAPLGVVCPVDGEVGAVEEVDCPYLQQPAVRILLRNMFFDVHSVHSPMEGKLLQEWFSSAGDSRGHAQWIQSDEGDDIVLVMATRLKMLRPRCYAQPGERIGQGQRCGYLHFGGVVEVWVPSKTRIAVKPGDRVVAGSDIIANLVHEKGAVSAATQETA